MATWDDERIKSYLLDMERPPHERANHRLWVEGNLARFLRTLSLVPPGAAGERCVEIGSMPYTFTLLMKKFRPYDMIAVDFLAGAEREHREIVRLPTFGERHEMVSHLCDLEREQLPLPDATARGVLLCEVLEHLTVNPTNVLAEIHRVLEPEGWLVLTTPNVASLANILDLLHGRNLYHPYELVFGPTWRHNREYTKREVEDLLTNCGFTIEEACVEDANPPRQRDPLSQRLLRRFLRLRYGQHYGAQLYVRARRGPVFRWYHPPWLFEHISIYMTPRHDYVLVGRNDAIQLGIGWSDTVPSPTVARPWRWMAGETATACIRQPPRRSRLLFDLYHEGPATDVNVKIGLHPSKSALAGAGGTLTIDTGGWHTTGVAVPATETERALAIELHHSAADGPPATRIGLAGIRWSAD